MTITKNEVLSLNNGLYKCEHGELIVEMYTYSKGDFDIVVAPNIEGLGEHRDDTFDGNAMDYSEYCVTLLSTNKEIIERSDWNFEGVWIDDFEALCKGKSKLKTPAAYLAQRVLEQYDSNFDYNRDCNMDDTK